MTELTLKASRLSPAVETAPVSTLPPAPSALESWFTWLFITVFFVLKYFDLRAYRVDSDEPQHLHVVWGWAHELIQYRDLFDNHTPLFQMLCAPFFAMIPERPDIEIPMRLLMFPLCAATLWMTAKIAGRLLGKRAGMWAALLTLALPGFFFTSEEFRTDDLWMVAWMLCVLLVFHRPFTTATAFWLGVAIGTSFGVSMKSSVLVLSLAIGGLGTLVLIGRKHPWPAWPLLVKRSLVFLGGALLIPLALVIFFAAHGALAQFYYCTVQHNMLGSFGKMKSPLGHFLRFAIHLALAFGVARFLLRRYANRPHIESLIFLALTTVALFAVLFNLWPVVTSQDYLPLYPLLGILLAVVLEQLPGKWRLPVGVTALAASLAFLIWVNPPWRDETSASFQIRAAALRLLRPDETIMDGKGETIYRPRPIYYVLELLTLKRMSAGLIKDDIPERMVAMRTCAARLTRLHGRDAEFVRQNYTDVGNKLYVAGKVIDNPPPGKPVDFDLAIPTTYDVVQPVGSFTGTLDGRPYHGAVALAAGHHQLVSHAATPLVSVIWERAITKGFSPFKQPKTAAPLPDNE